MPRHIIISVIICLLLTNVYSTEKYTAKGLFQKADSLAREYLTLPCLADIQSTKVDTTGQSDYWIFKHDSITVYVSYDSVNVKSSNLYKYIGWSRIKSTWIDSDSALAIAELNGGKQFRQKHDNINIEALLYGDSSFFFSVWEIKYYLTDSPNISKTISINANTGLIAGNTLVKNKETYFQKDFTLLQNFPNPFNSVTTISFNLIESGLVSLKIYNLSGQLLSTLIDGFLQKGNHQVIWQPFNYPSGIYFYQLCTPEFKSIRKIVLQK